jgi:hypothetical protein
VATHPASRAGGDAGGPVRDVGGIRGSALVADPVWGTTERNSR